MTRKHPFAASQGKASMIESENKLWNSIENNDTFTDSFKELIKAYNSHTKRRNNRERTRLTKLQVIYRLQKNHQVNYDVLLEGDPKGSTKEAREESTTELIERIATETAIATAESLRTDTQYLRDRAGVTGDYYEGHSDFS